MNISPKPLATLAALVLTASLAPHTPHVCQEQPQQQPSAAPQQADESQASPAAREALRKLRERPKTYKVGYSPAMERKLEELYGIEIPRNEARRARRLRVESQRRMAVQLKGQAEYIRNNPGSRFTQEGGVDSYLKTAFLSRFPGRTPPKTRRGMAPFLQKFDWGDHGILSPVVDQGGCNSCWAFAANAAFESNARLQNMKLDYMRFDIDKDGRAIPLPPAYSYLAFSVQSLLNCVAKEKGDCDSGGWHGSAFAFIVSNGIPVYGGNSFIPKEVETTDLLYSAVKEPCATKGGVRGVAWAYVADPFDRLPRVRELKEALLEHGPLAVLVHVDEPFKGYAGGVFDERNPDEANHAVLLTGWDDERRAWRIQNSFGEQWGEGGFMWIKWGSNHIGQYAAWIEAPITYDLGM